MDSTTTTPSESKPANSDSNNTTPAAAANAAASAATSVASSNPLGRFPTAKLALKRTQEALASLEKSSPEANHDRLAIAIAASFGLLCWVVAAMSSSEALAIKQDLNITGLFSSLLLVALFVERVIEVFVSVWCDPQTAVHEQNLDYWQTRKGQLEKDVTKLTNELTSPNPPDANRKTVIDQMLQEKRAAIEDALANADVEEKALIPFRARTQKVSTWIGLAIGVFVSAAGYRFLAQLVDASVLGKTPQGSMFVAADVLLTGAVLAGGSKLVHEIFAVYEAFMQTTSKSVSDKSKTQ